MEVISNIALISINETSIIQLLSFLIFMFIINKIMFKPLLKAMAERKNYIKKVKEDIIDSKKEIKSLFVTLEKREADVRKEAFSINEELQEESNRKAVELVEKTTHEIEEMRKKSMQEIAAKMNETKKYLKDESEALAFLIMNKALDRKLTR